MKMENRNGINKEYVKMMKNRIAKRRAKNKVARKARRTNRICS